MDAIETWKTTDGNTCAVYYDQDCGANNPREWHNLGRIIVPSTCSYFDSEENCGGLTWDDRDEDAKTLQSCYAYVFPLFVLDHSGIAVGIGFIPSPWGHWDCGQVGWIVVTEESAKEWNVRSEKQTRKTIEKELEILTQWANGEVYGYILTDPDGNELYSCWGYYSIEDIKAEHPEIEEAEA